MLVCVPSSVALFCSVLEFGPVPTPPPPLFQGAPVRLLALLSIRFRARRPPSGSPFSGDREPLSVPLLGVRGRAPAKYIFKIPFPKKKTEIEVRRPGRTHRMANGVPRIIINCFDIWNTPQRTQLHVQPTLARPALSSPSLRAHTVHRRRRPTRERRPTRSADTHQHMPLYATCERSSCTVHTHIPHPADPILCPRILVHTPRSDLTSGPTKRMTSGVVGCATCAERSPRCKLNASAAPTPPPPPPLPVQQHRPATARAHRRTVGVGFRLFEGSVTPGGGGGGGPGGPLGANCIRNCERHAGETLAHAGFHCACAAGCMPGAPPGVPPGGGTSM